MFIDPRDLQQDTAKLEEIEKASLRLVFHALAEFREEAWNIFHGQLAHDLAQDIAEDITREALDRHGVSKMDLRLFGKIDYKRARYIYHPGYAVRQALLVDSKAEKEHATATLQTAQTSLRIKHMRGTERDVQGELPLIIESPKGDCITTSIFVKYEYEDNPSRLIQITAAALPHGYLQDVYNPTATDTIWRAGRNAETRGEPFRVRLVFEALKNKARWRVQEIKPAPEEVVWDE